MSAKIRDEYVPSWYRRSVQPIAPVALLFALAAAACGARSSILDELASGPGAGAGAGGPGGGEVVPALVAGAAHTCALRGSGELRCWGSNGAGQLGVAAVDFSAVPIPVEGLPEKVVAVAAGGGFTCAIVASGGVLCWGSNEHGQLGGGAGEPSAAPVTVAGLSAPATALAAGETHACALLATGAIQCWGRGTAGQLGSGSFDEGPFPPVVVTGISDAIAVLAGVTHVCAVRASGALMCWGNNRYGEIGNGSPGVDSAVPVAVENLEDDIRAGAAGWDHTCAISESGAVRCWGNNFRGQLGNGTKQDSAYPTQTQDIATAAAIASSLDHVCAVLEGGEVRCWGTDIRGQLGDGDAGEMGQPNPVVVGGLPPADLVAAGHDHTCAALRSGGTMCWGQGDRGQLGNGASGEGLQSATPVAVTEP